MFCWTMQEKWEQIFKRSIFLVKPWGNLLCLGGVLFGIFMSPAFGQEEKGRKTSKSRPSYKRTLKMIKLLKPIHRKMGKVKPGDWLESHAEPGQSFSQYFRCRPVIPDRRRNRIYIQPIGDFTKEQRKVVEKTAKFMEIFFNLPVTIKSDLPLSEIPRKARRKHPHWGMKQILTTYVLHKVLKPKLPKDAMVYLAFTAADLWPGRGWNFVFGQASLRERVGVWSIYRNGDPAAGKANFRLCLLRTIKTATHETGHMFSMYHCIAFECNMCGSNSREESDRRPLLMCPECHAKLIWATGADPVKRFEELAAFCDLEGLDDEAEAYRRSGEVLANGLPKDKR